SYFHAHGADLTYGAQVQHAHAHTLLWAYPATSNHGSSPRPWDADCWIRATMRGTGSAPSLRGQSKPSTRQRPSAGSTGPVEALPGGKYPTGRTTASNEPGWSRCQ